MANAIQGDVLVSLVKKDVVPVLARTSTEMLRGGDVPIPKIASSLHVKCVVEGWVQRERDQYRVTAQLLRGDDGYVIASGSAVLWPDSTDQAAVAAQLTQNFGLDQCKASAP
jgi:TolB-like protein